MTGKIRSMIAAVVVLFALLMVSGAMAQSTPTPTPTAERELSGSVTAMTASTITVSGRVFNIAQAEIKGTISVGAFVKVHYSLSANGTRVVRQVEPARSVSIPGLNSVGSDDANDDNGVDDAATHDVNDDNGVDNTEIHDANDDHGGSQNQQNDNSGHGGNSGESGSDDSGHGGHGGHGGDD